jgi:hypothetical protein
MKNEEERTSLSSFLIRNSNFEIQSLVGSDVTLSVSEGLAGERRDGERWIELRRTNFE